ncbi:MAG: hypothetical protein R2695_10455 [Acidimicrobiales bacterium]
MSDITDTANTWLSDSDRRPSGAGSRWSTSMQSPSGSMRWAR